MIGRLGFFAATILCSSFAMAHIPTTNFIIGKLCQSHGKGSYIIDQEVTIKDSAGTAVIQEKLYVVDGGEALVIAKGSENLRIWRLLRRGHAYWTDNSSERADPISNNSAIPVLFSRTATDFKQRLLRQKILVSEQLQEKRLPKEMKDHTLSPEPNVRWGRVSGAVTYAFGPPAPTGGSDLTPGLWVEQDLFTVRKFRASPNAEFVADDPTEYGKGLVYPKQQTYFFNGHVATVRVLRVLAQEFPAEIKKQMDPASLRSRPESITVWPKTGLAPVIQDFYNNFR